MTKIAQTGLAVALMTVPLLGAGDTAHPVLAELFTSEGCSSCPPADALLDKLDKNQPVAGAMVVVLSEHVDYWNGAGWKDPFSSAAFTTRQNAYAKRLKPGDVYTPQLVIDGSEEMVGSNAAAVQTAIARSATRPKAAVQIISATKKGAEAIIEVQAEPLPSAVQFGKADLWVAVAGERYTSQVRRGENSGRTLSHVAVVREFRNAGQLTKTAGLHRTVTIPLGAGASDGPIRIVAFVQQPGQGAVAGAVCVPLK